MPNDLSEGQLAFLSVLERNVAVQQQVLARLSAIEKQLERIADVEVAARMADIDADSAERAAAHRVLPPPPPPAPLSAWDRMLGQIAVTLAAPWFAGAITALSAVALVIAYIVAQLLGVTIPPSKGDK